MERYRKSEYESKIHDLKNTINYATYPDLKVVKVEMEEDSRVNKSFVQYLKGEIFGELKKEVAQQSNKRDQVHASRRKNKKKNKKNFKSKILK